MRVCRIFLFSEGGAAVPGHQPGFPGILFSAGAMRIPAVKSAGSGVRIQSVLPPQNGAEQDGGSIGHAAQAKGSPPGGFGTDFVDHVPVEIGFSYPEEGEEDNDVAPDGDEQTRDRIFQIGGKEEGGGHHQSEEAESPREEQVFHLGDHQDQKDGAGKLEQPPDALDSARSTRRELRIPSPWGATSRKNQNRPTASRIWASRWLRGEASRNACVCCLFTKAEQMAEQQDGTQDVPRHMQRCHFIRMLKGGIRVHLNANLNDYPVFVKANQREKEENAITFRLPDCRTGLPAGEKSFLRVLGDFFKRGVLNGRYFSVCVKYHDSSLVAFQSGNHDFIKVLRGDDAAAVNGVAVAEPRLVPQGLPRGPRSWGGPSGCPANWCRRRCPARAGWLESLELK